MPFEMVVDDTLAREAFEHAVGTGMPSSSLAGVVSRVGARLGSQA
jgi:hypothetical protein